jgi:biotin carboxylase
MFHLRHHESASDFQIVAPRGRGVRLLETDEDLQAAVERASAFERARANRSGHGLRYERYLGGRPDELADVVSIDSEAASA